MQRVQRRGRRPRTGSRPCRHPGAEDAVPAKTEMTLRGRRRSSLGLRRLLRERLSARPALVLRLGPELVALAAPFAPTRARGFGARRLGSGRRSGWHCEARPRPGRSRATTSSVPTVRARRPATPGRAARAARRAASPGLEPTVEGENPRGRAAARPAGESRTIELRVRAARWGVLRARQRPAARLRAARAAHRGGPRSTPRNRCASTRAPRGVRGGWLAPRETQLDRGEPGRARKRRRDRVRRRPPLRRPATGSGGSTGARKIGHPPRRPSSG